MVFAAAPSRFQSTPSARRETSNFFPHLRQVQISIHSLRKEGDISLGSSIELTTDFNPLPPQGGRLQDFCDIPSHYYISIHSLRKEGDIARNGQSARSSVFQSTPSARRETYSLIVCSMPRFISIHSLRKEGDAISGDDVAHRIRISIHSLRKEGDSTMLK